MAGVSTVFHAATLHKPHIESHDRQAFVDTNVVGTLTLLEEAVRSGVQSFVFTSSTSAFGHAMRSRDGEPAVWVTEDTVAVPRNIYGATKTAAEALCQVVHQDHDLPVLVLRAARFFPEEDDRDDVRLKYEDANVKANEYLYRRVDLQDVVDAHLLAAERAAQLGFGSYIVSATTPFTPADAGELGRDAPAVVRRLFPDFEAEYGRRRWSMFPRIDRVYDNARARSDLDWTPQYDYRSVLESLQAGRDPRSELARSVGAKGYHAVTVAPYTRR
jgi:UDP-glucose 4-epimerase